MEKKIWWLNPQQQFSLVKTVYFDATFSPKQQKTELRKDWSKIRRKKYGGKEKRKVKERSGEAKGGKQEKRDRKKGKRKKERLEMWDEME